MAPSREIDQADSRTGRSPRDRGRPGVKDRVHPVVEPERVRLGVSACLLGEPVRYDGGHKRDRFLTDTLGPFVEWVPVCPEVEVGLGVPRDTLRLAGQPRAPRLVVARTGEDITARMLRYAGERVRELEALELDGYVLKRGSPSCGLSGVPVHRRDRTPPAAGRGLFAAELARRLPWLPLEEEGRLTDPGVREHFIERVFTRARWRAFVAWRPRARDLVDFHQAHELLLSAHSPHRCAEIGRLVAGVAGSGDARGAAGETIGIVRFRDRRPGRGERAVSSRVLDDYGRGLMRALAVRATRARHVNVLRHAAGFFERQLGEDERAELAEVIEEYRHGLVPLGVPVTLIRRHVRRLGLAYLERQVYFRRWGSP